MKLPLRYITLLVILSLTGVFAYQTYWLTSLYHTQRSEMEKDIREALRTSDYNEMIVRVRRMQNDSSAQAQVTVSTGYDDERAFTKTHTIRSVKHGDTIRVSIWERNTADTVPTPQAALQADIATMLFSNKSSADELASNFQQGLHAAMDVLNDPDFAVFDSLLRKELLHIGIDTPYRLIHLHLGSTVDSSYTFTDTLAIGGTADYRPSPQATSYNYSYDLHGNWNYLLILEPTENIVLAQMAGILTASALILIILGFAFGFLIRTLLRQKTLEEMKTDFTNNITHELKTPIAVAYAASDALLNFDTGTDPAKREQYLRICQEQLRRLSGLVEQILGMSIERRKTFRLHPETFPPEEVIMPLIEQHKLKADKPTGITLRIEPENLTVYADRTHFGNIVSNLIDNAIKYSPGEAQVEIKCRTENGWFILSVSDQGIGIPHDKQRHVFDKFYRVPTGNLHDVKGYGLGLYYVKTLTEKHGGTVEMKSEPRKGSEFTIKLRMKNEK